MFSGNENQTSHAVIMKTCPCNVHPLTPHFCIVKLCFQGYTLLAHLSRTYRILMVRRPSVVRRRSQCSKIFFSETALPIKAKFYVEPPWVGGKIFCSRHLGHMNKMAARLIYGKNPFKNLLLQNRRADFHETWYVASGTPAHHCLFK